MTVAQLMKNKVLVMGCGYVGQDLIDRLTDENWDVIAYDTNQQVIEEIKSKNPQTLYTSELKVITQFKIGLIFVCVPTPIYEDNSPDLRCVSAANHNIWMILKEVENPEEVIVIYESTYNPGTTLKLKNNLELLLKGKNLKFGYSPERIMPGGYEPASAKIVGADDLVLQELMADIYRPLYGDIYKCSTREAEAIKLIENTQKDINIAFMNCMSSYLHFAKINPTKVWKGLKTRADALKYTPGLVGGHCIPVDPWYLYHDSKLADLSIIELARSINNQAPEAIGLIAVNLALAYLDKDIIIQQLGITYKHNTKDIRNSGALELFRQIIKKELNTLVLLESMNYKITSYYDDPYIPNIEVGKWVIDRNITKANLVILAVPHRQYRCHHKTFMETYFLLDQPGVLMDLYGIFEEYSFFFGEHKIMYWRM